MNELFSLRTVGPVVRGIAVISAKSAPLVEESARALAADFLRECPVDAEVRVCRSIFRRRYGRGIGHWQSAGYMLAQNWLAGSTAWKSTTAALALTALHGKGRAA